MSSNGGGNWTALTCVSGSGCTAGTNVGGANNGKISVDGDGSQGGGYQAEFACLNGNTCTLAPPSDTSSSASVAAYGDANYGAARHHVRCCSMDGFQCFEKSEETGVCYDNYFQHIRGDMQWGGRQGRGDVHGVS